MTYPTRLPRVASLWIGALALLSLHAAAQDPDRGAPTPDSARVERRVRAMGTELTIEVVADDRRAALAASELALHSIEVVEARLSTWREDSELSGLQRTPLGTRFEPSARLTRDLRRALHWRDATGGAFSPTTRALVRAWGLRAGGRRPSPEELAAALLACAPGALEFDLPGGIVRRVRDAGIEEGGFGKGVALDEAAEALRRAGVTSAFLDFGGQTISIGTDATAAVALADPDDRERGVLRLELVAGSSATSGNSEHGITIDGRRLGHVLDPRSGRPARDFGSLTVCAASATDADCLSTGLYVMGPDAALRFASERPALDLIVLERGEHGLRARATAGLRGRLSPLDSELELEWFVPTTPDVEFLPHDPRKQQHR